MNEACSARGLPLRKAIFNLVSQTWQPHARTLLAEEESGRKDTARYRHLLWIDICNRIQKRELEAHGSLAGSDMPEPIDADFFRNAVPDYDADTVSASGRAYHAVRISPVGCSDDANGTAMSARHDWPAFNRELIRVTNLDSVRTGQELTDHMMAWCAARWPVQPDPATLHGRVSSFCSSVTPET